MKHSFRFFLSSGPNLVVRVERTKGAGSVSGGRWTVNVEEADGGVLVCSDVPSDEWSSEKAARETVSEWLSAQGLPEDFICTRVYEN